MFETELSHMNWVKEYLTLPYFALKCISSPMGPLLRLLKLVTFEIRPYVVDLPTLGRRTYMSVA